MSGNFAKMINPNKGMKKSQSRTKMAAREPEVLIEEATSQPVSQQFLGKMTVH